MKKKIYLKKRTNRKKSNIFIIIFLLLIIFTFMTLKIISDRITPIIFETAEIEVNKYSTIVINKAISQVLEDKISTDKIFTTVISNDGKIQTVDFNPIVINQMLNIATTVVQDNLKLLEEGNLDSIGIYDVKLSNTNANKLKKGIITEIPIGIIFKNTILSNLGPKIPIKLHYLGDVNSNITTKVTPYGINNALLEVGVNLEMNAKIILPFQTKKMKLNCKIPIVIKVIQGYVPSYYGGEIIKDSSIYSLPFE